MSRHRLMTQPKDYILYTQCTVRISRRPNGTHDVFLHSTLGVVTCSRFIRNPRRP